MVHSEKKFLLCYIQYLQIIDIIIWLEKWERQTNLEEVTKALSIG